MSILLYVHLPVIRNGKQPTVYRDSYFLHLKSYSASHCKGYSLSLFFSQEPRFRSLLEVVHPFHASDIQSCGDNRSWVRVKTNYVNSFHSSRWVSVACTDQSVCCGRKSSCFGFYLCVICSCPRLLILWLT